MYFAVVFVFIILWFVLLFGQANKVPKNQTLYVWLSYSLEGSDSTRLEVYDILNNLEENYGSYNYKKMDYKVGSLNPTKNEDLNTFTVYADVANVDLFILPNYCFEDDDMDDIADVETGYLKSNTLFCDRFVDMDLMLKTDRQDYLDLYNNLQSQGKLVSFTGIDSNKNYLPSRIVGIKINEDYVLAISRKHTLQADTLVNLINDILELN